MKNKERIKILEKRVDQLEKDLKLQKWLADSILTLQRMKMTGENAVRPFEPVKLQTGYTTPMCGEERNKYA